MFAALLDWWRSLWHSGLPGERMFSVLVALLALLVVLVVVRVLMAAGHAFMTGWRSVSTEEQEPERQTETQT